MRRKHRDTFLFLLNVGNVDIGFHEGFKHSFFITARKRKNRAVIKHVTNAAGSANFAFRFGKAAAHITKGAIGVVGQTVDDHHHVTGTKAFIARW